MCYSNYHQRVHSLKSQFLWVLTSPKMHTNPALVVIHMNDCHCASFLCNNVLVISNAWHIHVFTVHIKQFSQSCKGLCG